jgi:hypothetical protein
MAEQVHEPSFGEKMASASIRKWYNDVTFAMNLSEVRPGSYEYRNEGSSSGTSALIEGSETAFVIKAHRFQMISIPNSYITVKHRIPITIPAYGSYTGSGAERVYTGPTPTEYYVGYRDAAAIFIDYHIYSNNDVLQKVDNATLEWFLNDVSTLDSAKENNVTYATLKKIRERNPNVPGTYISIKDITAETNVLVEFDLKIPLNRFLAFRNLNWIADWMGEFTLVLFPSFSNIVIAPVIPEETFIIYPQIQVKVDEINNAPAGTTDAENRLVDFGFYQLDQPMRNKFKIEENGTVTMYPEHTWKSHKQHKTVQPGLKLATFYLRENVANDLKNEYTNVPLLFPIQVVNRKIFTTQIGNEEDFTPSCSPNFKCSDAAYILFRENDATSTQRFVNPFINYQVRIGGRQYPSTPSKTTYDHNNTNQTLDAFNINNSRIFSVSEDVRTSMHPFTRYTNYVSGGATDSSGYVVGTTSYHWSLGDRGRFFIGFPFCDSNIFQGGLTLGKDQIELKGRRMDNCPPKLAKIKYQSPVIVITSDRIMKIRSEKPVGSPQVEIATATFDELMMAG